MRRLYNAVCEWLEASAKAMSETAEPEPEGAGASQAEHAHSYTTKPEMHAGYGRGSIDDDDGGVYRLGFQPSNPNTSTAQQ
ncbi:hypothetical protein QN084_06270 [Paenarthrobacter sp. R1]|uniref:hypothetical protein n=1 Tax=Paenarthrobacter sp. R1 TaxID=3049085 RepID=UPI002554CA57|nr:hypothetical protein [Paenarthrobacter sp. R1]WIV32213.1 hypothetical protein QN084_06270 [Paenarthrobacter sp. R1]